jgi:hypothetical protein
MKSTTIKQVFVCRAEDMHPYNCDTPYGGTCIHCDRRKTKDHNPKTCVLCNYFGDERDEDYTTSKMKPKTNEKENTKVQKKSA